MTTLVKCDGFRWGRVEVPRFTLAEGEAVCLHLPPVSSPRSAGEWGERSLSEHFTGEIAEAAITLGGVALRAIHPRPPRFLGFSRNPLLNRWLTQHAGLSPLDADDVMQTMGLSRRVRLCDTSWTQRMVVALRAALHRQPQILVFDGWGLGDDGLEQMFQAAAQRTPVTSVIYVSHPGSRQRPCFPRARCLSLTYCLELQTSAA